MRAREGGCSVSEQAVRFHMLKALGRAPALGRFAMQGGSVEEEDVADDDKKGRDIEIGSATHAIVLGTQRVVACPMARNEKHKAYQEFMAENAGALIVTPAQYETASRTAGAIRSHRDVAPLLDGASMEDTLYFEHLGVKCRATPDVRARHIAELKSTKSAAPWEFLRDAERRCYHAQVAMQRMACIEACGYTPSDCFIIAAEKTPPYLVTVVRLSERTLAAGEDLIGDWLELLLECRRTGEWPGYAVGVVDWELPDVAGGPLSFGQPTKGGDHAHNCT